MLAVRTSAHQYDIPISAKAQYIYDKLLAMGVNSTEILGYDRIYRIKDKKGYKPYVYVSNNDYAEVLLDDKKSIVFFFGTSDEIKYDGAWGEIDVHLVLMANAIKLQLNYETSTRPDMELRRIIFDLVRQPHKGFTLVGEVVGFDKTFADYSGLKEDANFDMNPYHSFRYNFKLRFPINATI